MTEEPYRWLEAIGNRREYVQHQLRGGSPVLAASLDAGIVLVGVGTGQSKVFEIFDRHALAGLGHPADLERVRQGLIDAAHLEAFARAPEDVTLRRLVGFNLGPQLKTAFEQLFAPPFILRLLLAELGIPPAPDVLLKLHFDGTFTHTPGPVAVLAADPALEAATEAWLRPRLPASTSPTDALPILLHAWHSLTSDQPLPDPSSPAHPPSPETAAFPMIPDLAGRQIEAALLRRHSPIPARYLPLALSLPPTAPTPPQPPSAP